MESVFYDAARDGKVEELREILEDNPTLDVNWRNPELYNSTSLHRACNGGHDAVVSILLAHPGIDINARNDRGGTPWLWSCTGGHSSCARLMLKDPRVLINATDKDGRTALWWATLSGHVDIAMWWIASGRDFDLGRPGDIDKTDAIGAARKFNKLEMVPLLERFRENPVKTRHEVRLELRWYDGAAAEMFALVVFVSDGLLQISQGDEAATSPSVRFFLISRGLPLELQMVLCCRVVGSSKEIIPGQASEAAFKNLAKIVASS